MSTQPVAIGANCGVGASELVATVLGISEARPDAAVVAKGNCGIPQYVDGHIHYTGTPELMADYARIALDAGAKIIGGCCGTSPEHLAAMRKSLETYTRGERPTVEVIEQRLGPVSELAKGIDAAAAGASFATTNFSTFCALLHLTRMLLLSFYPLLGSRSSNLVQALLAGLAPRYPLYQRIAVMQLVKSGPDAAAGLMFTERDEKLVRSIGEHVARGAIKTLQANRMAHRLMDLIDRTVLMARDMRMQAGVLPRAIKATVRKALVCEKVNVYMVDVMRRVRRACFRKARLFS